MRWLETCDFLAFLLCSILESISGLPSMFSLRLYRQVLEVGSVMHVVKVSRSKHIIICVRRSFNLRYTYYSTSSVLDLR